MTLYCTSLSHEFQLSGSIHADETKQFNKTHMHQILSFFDSKVEEDVSE